jgi:surfeit locus 1 family protein
VRSKIELRFPCCVLLQIQVLDFRLQRLEEEPIPVLDAMNSFVEVAGSRDKHLSSSRTAVDELEFRKVICEGVYDVEKNLYVGPRARSAMGVTQKGYFVITPLRTPDSSKRWVSHSNNSTCV